MTPNEIAAMQAENRFLKQRVLTLQDDVTNLSAQVDRLSGAAHAAYVRRDATPNPLGGGQ